MSNTVKKTYPSNGKGGPTPMSTPLVSQAKSMPKNGSASNDGPSPSGSKLVNKPLGKGMPKSGKA